MGLVHEYTLSAFRSYAAVRVVPERLQPAGGPVEVKHGVAYKIQFTVDIPVHRVPEDQAKVSVTAATSVAFSKPQGVDADGDPIPTVTTEVANFDTE